MQRKQYFLLPTVLTVFMLTPKWKKESHKSNTVLKDFSFFCSFLKKGEVSALMIHSLLLPHSRANLDGFL